MFNVIVGWYGNVKQVWCFFWSNNDDFVPMITGFENGKIGDSAEAQTQYKEISEYKTYFLNKSRVIVTCVFDRKTV